MFNRKRFENRLNEAVSGFNRFLKEDKIKFDWQPDNLGGFKASPRTAYAEYNVNVNASGWMIAKGSRLIYAGRTTGVDTAKQAVEKFLKQMQIRGL